MIKYDDNGNKKCSKCKEFKSLDLFGNVHTTSDKKRSQCKACIKLYKDTDVYKAIQKRYEAGPAGKAKKKRARNTPKAKLSKSNRSKKTYREHKGIVRSKHRSIKPHIPPWLTEDQWKQIDKIYNECPIGYEVDHIYPRIGKNENGEHIACGLHVPWNLQYLTKVENASKSSKMPKK